MSDKCISKADKEKPEKQKTSIIRDPNWVERYARGATSETTPYDFKVHFYSEVMPMPIDDKGTIAQTQINNLSLVLSHRALKELAYYLIQHTLLIEDKQKGTIKVSDIPIKRIQELVKTFGKLDWERYINDSRED